MTLLFTPLSLRDVVFRNRLWVAPMCQYSAVEGVPNGWHHTHLSQFALGGAGLVVAEATAVVPEGRISPRDTGIWNDEQRDAWAPIVRAIHDLGGAAGIQLAHAGRKASTWWPFSGRRGSVPLDEGGWLAEAPSPLAFEGYAVPAELDPERIDEIVAAFGAAARRALDAGFDVLEIHAAHGYLIHEFLSPLSNERTDAWGGDLRGRARLLIDVVRAVRAEAGSGVPVFVRYSATDNAAGGLSTADVAEVARWAAEAGADLADVSTSGLVAHQQVEAFPGYQVPHAAEIRATAGSPTAAVGLITTGVQAEEILQSGAADAIFAGREWLRDAHFALRAAAELGEDPEGIWPEQYLRAFRPVR